MTLLDVDDCAGAIVHLADQAQAPTTVNLLAPGQWTRQREFTETLAGLLNSRVRRVDVRDRRQLRDPAVAEALTSSLRATTSHAGALAGYAWTAPRWPDILARHLVPS
jgi:nucleoside-diphosphate-sugar epimerase